MVLFMNKLKKLKIFPIILLCLFLLCQGCSAVNNDYGTYDIQETAQTSENGSGGSVGSKNSGSGYRIETPDDILSAVPGFSGEAYAVLNNNYPDFTAEEKQNTTAFERYSELDGLGRCRTAFANICPELMPDEERGDIGRIKPSGWHLVKYDIVDGKYLYNRCHLIGYQLAGENANEKNLLTGTRFFNVSGMLPFENQVADYVTDTGNHVLYRVTPVYNGNDLVAAGVRMEAYSVEDGGEGVCFNVFVYNSQPGITIEYATGESRLDEAGNSASGDEEGFSEEYAEQITYILNTNTKKFHLPACDSVDDIKEKNKKKADCTREELIEEGYSPCKRCNP